MKIWILNVVGSAVDVFDDQPMAIVYGQSPICKDYRINTCAHELVGTGVSTINKQEFGFISYSNSQDLISYIAQDIAFIPSDVVHLITVNKHLYSAHSVLIVLNILFT